MEDLEKEQKQKEKNRLKYEKSKEKIKQYYLDNKESILEKMKSAPDYKEKVKEKNQKMREYKTEWARQKRQKANERQRIWWEKNKDKMSGLSREKYLKRKMSKEGGNKEKELEYLSPMKKNQLIEWAVEFVSRVEARRGLVSFEELFGELLGIAFYIPTNEKQDDTIEGQLTQIWNDVKFLANGFKKDLDGEMSDEFYNEMRDKGICRYCEVNKIECTNNTCYKCKSLMIYLNKLG